MQWVSDNFRAQDWIVPFILTKTDLVGYPPLQTAPLGKRLQLHEVVEYPPIELPIFKVFKDRLDSYHYISIASRSTVEEYFQSRNIQVESLITLTNPLYPQRRIFKQPENRRVFYCLPEVRVHERSQS